MSLIAVEQVIRGSRSVARLRAPSETAKVAVPTEWREAGSSEAHSVMASTIFLHPAPKGEFVPNIVIQYFDFDSHETLSLSSIATDKDIASLYRSVVFGHHVSDDGLLSVDEGAFNHEGLTLAVRRVHHTYPLQSASRSGLTVITSTAPIKEWKALEPDISTIELNVLSRKGRWGSVTTP
ncbi:hypothetical protein QNM97_10425 [Gordonia sp. L191]|uniref:hypothetical protein n=1 Tax=Gordonia sp. L191 TaxID=2982699 RepID=UPI0024C0355E|nr:hypothetical protein [Gordonia sp. L191]WHU49348.1 hypothetical protein QNM97_10425 [Gordonia sp. L191]